MRAIVIWPPRFGVAALELWLERAPSAVTVLIRATAIAVRRNARTLRRGCTGGSFGETTVATEQRSGDLNYPSRRRG
jgi:hypothetical protein